MCGIAGVYFKNPDRQYITPKETEDLVDWLFCGIEHRGTHASGIAVQDKEGKTFVEKSDMSAGKFIFWREDLVSDPRIILLHTRWATKGKPENLLNNHPIEYKNIVAIHNGHISNDDELFKSEELDRIAEVDSEIIPALLQKYTFNDPKAALEKMSGGFAISAFDSENPGKLLLAKGPSSPLVYVETSGMWVWASEEKVLKEALEMSIGYETKKSDFFNLDYGKYIEIEGEGFMLREFKPYFKSYVNSGTKSWNNRTQDGGKTVPNKPYIPPKDYADGWRSNSYGREKCDECFVWCDTNKVTQIGTNKFCEHCQEKLFNWILDEEGNTNRKPRKKLSRKERKALRKEAKRKMESSKNEHKQKTIILPKADSLGEALENEHDVICQLVAEFYGTKPEFVDFMLSGQIEDGADFEDPNLVTMYMEFEEKYQEYLKEIRGETDAIIEELDKRKYQSSFPVGFGGI